MAVQSHYFSVGSVVTWARSGVGAIATQSTAEISYGPIGLELMASGKTSQEALQSLLKTDQRADVRQVGMVDSHGNVATYTGSRCIDFAGHSTGDQFSCQANLMSNDTVWSAMEKKFRESDHLELPERLVGTLEAADAAGGDARGKQSAALLVVSSKIYPNSWMGRIVELRVEDSPEPLAELKRLLRMKRAYDWVDKGDDFLASGRFEESMHAYVKADEIVPNNEEIRFWVGVTQMGSPATREQGIATVCEIFGDSPNWKSVARSLLQKGYLSKDNSLGQLL